MPISVEDKVVVITGGAGEMGSAIARRLVDEGAKVVLADIADGSRIFLDLHGRQTKNVHLRGEPTSAIRPTVVLGVDVPKDALVHE